MIRYTQNQPIFPFLSIYSQLLSTRCIVYVYFPSTIQPTLIKKPKTQTVGGAASQTIVLSSYCHWDLYFPTHTPFMSRVGGRLLCSSNLAFIVIQSFPPVIIKITTHNLLTKLPNRNYYYLYIFLLLSQQQKHAFTLWRE